MELRIHEAVGSLEHLNARKIKREGQDEIYLGRLLQAQIKAAEAQREREQLKPEMKTIEAHVDELCGVPKEWTDQWHQSNERVNHEVMAQLNIARQLLVRCHGFVPRTTRLYQDINLFMAPKYRTTSLKFIREIPPPDELDASAKRMMAQVRQDGEDRRQSEANAERALALQGKPTRAQELSMIAEHRALRKFLTGSVDGVL